jgi:UDP-N-acetylmuramoyl-L-alanyl-D-glutamate--2,6-diaminopimelate ligase
VIGGEDRSSLPGRASGEGTGTAEGPRWPPVPDAPPRPLGELLDRLAGAGLMRGIRRGGQPLGRGEVAGILVRGVSSDTRQLTPGQAFVALRGAHVDGHRFVAEAARRGAPVALVEEPVEADPAIVEVVVTAGRPALAEAACWAFADPSRALLVVGVTGTDGKTTTSILTAAVLAAAGHRPGLVTTAELWLGGRRLANPEHITTPEAPQLQALLRAMVDGGSDAVVIETTSHALAQERVRGVAYDVAVFTNLSHEHLDYHGSFAAYQAAKLRLFEALGRRWEGKGIPAAGIVNVDDPAGERFAAAARTAGARVIGFGTDPRADVRTRRVEDDGWRLRMELVTPRWAGPVELRLPGRFNVHNALAAAAVAEALELDPAAVVAGLASVDRVPGRMERIDAGQPFDVIVDYAHSPAALTQVLDILEPRAAARGGGLVVVFGSAGERDREKRPRMGRIAGERCRLVVLTDEDPRGEDREAILEEIAVGAEAVGRRRGVDLLLVPNREEAIRAALQRASPGDVVLLAGKGHEGTILYADGPRPWDEAAVARRILAELGYGG